MLLIISTKKEMTIKKRRIDSLDTLITIYCVAGGLIIALCNIIIDKIKDNGGELHIKNPFYKEGGRHDNNS